MSLFRWGCTCSGSGLRAEQKLVVLQIFRERQGEPECRAHTRLWLDPDPAAVLVHDCLAHGKPCSGLFLCLRSVQARKHPEDVLAVFCLDAYSIVLHFYPDFVARNLFSLYQNPR
jgi:hypothetical protein